MSLAPAHCLPEDLLHGELTCGVNALGHLGHLLVAPPPLIFWLAWGLRATPTTEVWPMTPRFGADPAKLVDILAGQRESAGPLAVGGVSVVSRTAVPNTTYSTLSGSSQERLGGHSIR